MTNHKNIMNRILLFGVVVGTTFAPTATQISANQVAEANIQEYYPGWSGNQGWPHRPNQDNNHNHGQNNKSQLTVKDVSRDARDYNAIILGNHYVSKADIEGATIVQGNVVLRQDRPGEQPHFDYGASGSGAGNLIGNQGLKANVPSLMLGGTVSGAFGKIKVLGKNVGVRERVSDITALDGDAQRVQFTDAQMDAFMATIRNQMSSRYDHFSKIAETVKPTGNDFKIQPAPGNPRIGVVYMSAPNIKLSGVRLPDVNQYDRIIVKLKANNVVFANGAMLKSNGAPLDVNQPVGTPENNLMRQYAEKLTWIMDDTTQSVAINGFGIIGDFYAPNANLDGNGGNINGQLFINSLTQRGGFEVHNLPEGARNDRDGVPPLETLEFKPNTPEENVLDQEDTQSFEDLNELPPFKPEDGKADSTKEPELEKPVQPTDKPEVHIKPNESKEEVVPDESETLDDLEVVPPYNPENDKAEPGKEPELEKPLDPGTKPEVHIKPNESKEEVVPDESETLEDLDEVPPYNPGEGKATEGETPKLEDIIKPTEKPEVEIGPHFPTEEKLEDGSESTDELPTLPPFIPGGDKATEGETPKLEDIIKPTDKPKVEILPNQPKEDVTTDESESADELPTLPPFIPDGDKATEGETPKLEEGIKPTDKPKVEILPNQPREEMVEDNSESTDDLEVVPPYNPGEGKAVETNEPKLEDSIKPTDKPKVEIGPNMPTEEKLEDGSESTDELPTLPPFIPGEDKATEGETPKLEDIIKPTEKPEVQVEPNQPKDEKLEDESESLDELDGVPPYNPGEGKAVETNEPKLEDSIKPTNKPKVDFVPNQPTEEKLEDGSESTDELPTLPPFMPGEGKAKETIEPKLEKNIKPTEKPQVNNDKTPNQHVGGENVKSMLNKRLDDAQTTLPNTGERSANSVITLLGWSMLAVLIALLSRKSRKN